jgi:hypothetical protein
MKGEINMLTEYLKEQLRNKKHYTIGNIVLKTADGIYTWYSDTKALYFKKPKTTYFSEKGKFLGYVLL